MFSDDISDVFSDVEIFLADASESWLTYCISYCNVKKLFAGSVGRWHNKKWSQQ
jgi:hypothetical protein